MAISYIQPALTEIERKCRLAFLCSDNIKPDSKCCVKRGCQEHAKAVYNSAIRERLVTESFSLFTVSPSILSSSLLSYSLFISLLLSIHSPTRLSPLLLLSASYVSPASLTIALAFVLILLQRQLTAQRVAILLTSSDHLRRRLIASALTKQFLNYTALLNALQLLEDALCLFY